MTNNTAYSLWTICEQFNLANLDQFTSLLEAGRLNHIGYCLQTGRTGEFETAAEALAWIAEGRNVYADIGHD